MLRSPVVLKADKRGLPQHVPTGQLVFSPHRLRLPDTIEHLNTNADESGDNSSFRASKHRTVSGNSGQFAVNDGITDPAESQHDTNGRPRAPVDLSMLPSPQNRPQQPIAASFSGSVATPTQRGRPDAAAAFMSPDWASADDGAAGSDFLVDVPPSMR